MKRRTVLQQFAVAPWGLLLAQIGQAAPLKTGRISVQELHKNWQLYLSEGADAILTTDRLNQTEEKWKELLTPQQFEVLRLEGTERPFTSPLNDEKRTGIFVCAGCSLPVFTSAMKYDSGTGWPSFFTSIPGAFATKRDFKLILLRTEYHCVRCGGHHGHIFNDGPQPTGQRWCNNGVALRFIPNTKMSSHLHGESAS